MEQDVQRQRVSDAARQPAGPAVPERDAARTADEKHQPDRHSDLSDRGEPPAGKSRMSIPSGRCIKRFFTNLILKMLKLNFNKNMQI